MSSMNENNDAAATVNENNSSSFPPPLFSEAPIILASTHGVYDLTIEPTKFTVPPNVYIFETQTIGSYCLTSMDRPLWNIIKWRGSFLWYFAGQENVAPGFSEATDEEARRVFQHMHYYEPGDIVYNRLLSIGGGRTSAGDSARRTYDEMGFYRFDAGDVEAAISSSGDDDLRISELEPLRTEMIGDQDKNVSYKKFIDDYIGMHPELAETDIIFIFSCCANFWKEEDDKKVPKKTLERRLRLIENKQREQDLKLASLTTAGPGGAGTDVIVNLPESRVLPQRKGLKARAVYAPDINVHATAYNADADPEFEGRMNVNARGQYTPRIAAGQTVFIRNNSTGIYKAITTAKGSLAFTRRNIANAKARYGTVYLPKNDGFVAVGGRQTRKNKLRRSR